MTNNTVSTMTEAEVAALGLDDLDGSNDNPVVSALLRGESREDGKGHPIISYKQYLELSAAGQRLDNFMLVLKGPTGTGLAPAGKLQKYWGDGFRPIELVEHQEKLAGKRDDRAEVAFERDRPTVVSKDDLVIYPCNHKYQDCPRFFDSPRARQTHWGIEHEKKLTDKKGRKNGS